MTRSRFTNLINTLLFRYCIVRSTVTNTRWHGHGNDTGYNTFTVWFQAVPAHGPGSLLQVTVVPLFCTEPMEGAIIASIQASPMSKTVEPSSKVGIVLGERGPEVGCSCWFPVLGL